MDTNFLIVVTVYNSENYIGDCVNSILNQRYRNFRLTVVDDCSTDRTPNILKKIDGFKLIKNRVREGSGVANIVKAIKMTPGEKEDVILIVDGDDWLYDNNVLDYLNMIYQDSSVWLTYGQFTSLSGRMENYCTPLADTRRYRQYGKWTTSHPKTMKRFLWDKIKDVDLRDRHMNYYKRFEDIAYMYPAVEMAGLKHIRCISKILYVYNDRNSLCTLNIYNEKKILSQIMPIKLEIQKKTPYPELHEIP